MKRAGREKEYEIVAMREEKSMDTHKLMESRRLERSTKHRRLAQGDHHELAKRLSPRGHNFYSGVVKIYNSTIVEL